MEIMGLNAAVKYAQTTYSSYQSQSGLLDGENSLYVGATDKNSNITSTTDKSKFFLGADEDTENFLVTTGDDVDIVNGDGKAQIVAAGSNYNIDSKGETKVYYQGDNANISLGDGNDEAVLSGSNINFNAGNGDNKISSGSFDIKLTPGEFYMNYISDITPVVVDQDLAISFGIPEEDDEQEQEEN